MNLHFIPHQLLVAAILMACVDVVWMPVCLLWMALLYASPYIFRRRDGVAFFLCRVNLEAGLSLSWMSFCFQFLLVLLGGYKIGQYMLTSADNGHPHWSGMCYALGTALLIEFWISGVVFTDWVYGASWTRIQVQWPGRKPKGLAPESAS